MKEMPGATFVAAAFCLMQKSPIDKAMYYDALPSRRFCGLYYFPSMKTTKTYFAFKAFNELYKLGTVVESVGDEPNGIFVCAAKGDSGAGAVLIVNRNTVAQTVELQVSGCHSRPVCTILDASRRFEEVGRLPDKFLCLPSQAVALLRYSADPEVDENGDENG